MYNFKGFLQDLNVNAAVPFNLLSEDGKVIYEGCPNLSEAEKVEALVWLGKQRARLVLSSKHEMCTSLIKYYIENKYKELFSMREQIFIDVLQGKSIPEERIDKNFPFLSQGSRLLLVSVDGSKYEALNIVKQIYNEQDIVSLIYEESIVVIGNFDEVKEHAESIRDSIISNLYCRCHISYSDEVYNPTNLNKAYESAKEGMLIGKKFGVKGEIYDYGDMVFEKTVYNIKSPVKEEFLAKFKDKFDSFDNEMVNTVEEFMNCGLNISDAAKKLYIHRNTLIYRLDKIAKDTGYDIRDFKQATIFVIAFLIWRESK